MKKKRPAHPVISDPRYVFRGGEAPFYRANEPANAAAWFAEYRKREAKKKAENAAACAAASGPVFLSASILRGVDGPNGREYPYRTNRALRRAKAKGFRVRVQDGVSVLLPKPKPRRWQGMSEAESVARALLGEADAAVYPRPVPGTLEELTEAAALVRSECNARKAARRRAK